jgi:hypothetical protein
MWVASAAAAVSPSSAVNAGSGCRVAAAAAVADVARSAAAGLLCTSRWLTADSAGRIPMHLAWSPDRETFPASGVVLNAACCRCCSAARLENGATLQKTKHQMSLIS